MKCLWLIFLVEMEYTVCLAKRITRGSPEVNMPSHLDVAKRIFDDAKQNTSQHEDSAQWDLLNGLSELCLAVESLEVEIGQLKTEINRLQR
jgi:hypothetical protein